MLWMTFSQTPYTADFIVIIGVLFYNVKEMSGKSLKNMLLKSAENYLKKVFVNLLKTLDRMGGGRGAYNNNRYNCWHLFNAGSENIENHIKGGGVYEL